MRYGIGLALLLMACGGEQNRVRISLPLPPKLDLSLYNQIYIAGFIASDKNQDFDSDAETLNFFRREFIRRNAIDVVEHPPMELSDQDPRSFFDRVQPEFTKIEDMNKEDTLILTGEVSYEILDRSGFRQVEGTDISGNRFYQTRFVEATGYLLKLRIFVYELKEGNLLYRESLQDEIDVDGPPGDTKLAFNALLDRMSTSVLGLFSNTTVRAERNLL
ncbi:MAG: hypothetical protein H6510_17975 [Acidobacteria bacterium]|nr:hypothetical protein [Acidobacteriota bacterium]MCB9399706.1 hypothetical protein [Acidobacteriota bacterium]